MDDYGYSHGLDFLQNNEKLDGRWYVIKAVNGSVTLSNIQFRGHTNDLNTNIELQRMETIEGPIKSVTKSSGNGILFCYRVQK